MLLLTLLLTLAPGAQPAQPSKAHVVFVCEHGAAKSLIAAAYFNKLASERGLAARAVFRGVDPQDALSVRAVEGLRKDGIALPEGRPTALDAEDIAGATHIFAIGCALPRQATESGRAASWSDVPDDRGYDAMRDAIVRHVKALVDELSAAPKREASSRE